MTPTNKNKANKIRHKIKRFISTERDRRLSWNSLWRPWKPLKLIWNRILHPTEKPISHKRQIIKASTLPVPAPLRFADSLIIFSCKANDLKIGSHGCFVFLASFTDGRAEEKMKDIGNQKEVRRVKAADSATWVYEWSSYTHGRRSFNEFFAFFVSRGRRRRRANTWSDTRTRFELKRFCRLKNITVSRCKWKKVDPWPSRRHSRISFVSIFHCSKWHQCW